ncbi:MAG: 4Fe-4S ferredoxin [Candidatus Omnitrophica bacterium CG07_land_8_20_14_0_80_42_15]|uniref:4Fe-4S ferredoxin n=1 Tax=Candidatus Aquitaenariimonas noxiae TaxID=1974741 RepID=A0A2J0L055_9BACT|nr:MAG: 4Fe-4S ferredoxin [Candidatus Omnitrophica bacterium CG07_land_8_20_14_0_80_42_15]
MPVKRIEAMGKVYFVKAAKSDGKSEIIKKIEGLLEASDCFDFIKKGDIVAVKVTFGEKGNEYYVGPEYVKVVLNKIKKLGGKPFLTDANVLYKGERTNAVDHLNLAREHGFLRCDVPVIIADGLFSKNYKKIAIDKKHFKTVNIARDVVDSDCIVSISHFKGHMQTGFGAALKNIGMGLASRSGKQMQHSHVKPEVRENKCVLCKQCFDICPVSAISEKNGKAFIDKERCIGCAECVATCKFFAIAITWEESAEILQEKMVEHAFGALKNKKDKAVFMNFALEISKECDCWNLENPIIAKDVGIFLSNDPVAVDKAAADKVVKQEVNDVFKKAHPDTNWHRQLEYGASLGLGKLDYKLVEV